MKPPRPIVSFTPEQHAEVIDDLGTISVAHQPTLQVSKRQEPLRELL
jgi:hypothetical protein